MRRNDTVQFTITTNDPEGYLRYMLEQYEEGFTSGHVDFDNHWSMETVSEGFDPAEVEYTIPQLRTTNENVHLVGGGLLFSHELEMTARDKRIGNKLVVNVRAYQHEDGNFVMSAHPNVYDSRDWLAEHDTISEDESAIPVIRSQRATNFDTWCDYAHKKMVDFLNDNHDAVRHDVDMMLKRIAEQ